MASLALFREDLDKVDQCLGGLFNSTTKIEFQLAVKVLAAGENIGTGQAAKGEIRTIGAAANRSGEWLQTCAPRRFERIVGQLRIVLQHFLHVLVVLFDLDADL